jgi:hypothetical protein
VLRRKQRDELNARRFEQNINRRASRAIPTGVVRDQTDSHSGKLLEAVALQNIDAREYLSVRHHGRLCRRPCRV